MDIVKKYLSENNLKFKTDDIKKKYLCLICGDILCQPKISRCGCKFCSKCLSTEYNHQNNQCPSCNKHLNLEIDIGDDFSIEIKISDLLLTCPNLFCREQHKVNELIAHLETCVNKGIKCIFHLNGCGAVFNSDTNMQLHLSANLKYHMNLLIIDISKEDEKVNRIENEIKTKIDDKYDRANRKILEIKRSFEEMNKSFDAKSLNLENQIKLQYRNELTMEMENFRREMHQRIQERFGNMLNINNVGDDLSKKVTFQNVNKKVKDLEYFSDKLCINSYSFKISFSYFSNGYMRIGVCLMKGENDTQISWPLKNGLNLAIHRDDGHVYTNQSFSYATTRYDWQKNFGRPSQNFSYLEDSFVGIHSNRLIKDNEVTVTLTMLK